MPITILTGPIRCTQAVITGEIAEDGEQIASAIRSLPDAADAVDDPDEIGESIASDARQRLLKLEDKRDASGQCWFMGNVEFVEGMAVLAVLEEDGEFHEAAVVSVGSASHSVDEGASHSASLRTATHALSPCVTVAFGEFGGMQRVVATTAVLVLSKGATETTVEGVCEMCRRGTKVTDHHLIPRSEHSRYVKRGLTSAFLKGRENIAELCRPCHSTVHNYASNKALADKYDTTAKLLDEEPIAKWIEWVAGQAHGVHRRV